jgi:hypothetical protein
MSNKMSALGFQGLKVVALAAEDLARAEKFTGIRSNFRRPSKGNDGLASRWVT